MHLCLCLCDGKQGRGDLTGITSDRYDDWFRGCVRRSHRNKLREQIQIKLEGVRGIPKGVYCPMGSTYCVGGRLLAGGGEYRDKREAMLGVVMGEPSCSNETGAGGDCAGVWAAVEG